MAPGDKSGALISTLFVVGKVEVTPVSFQGRCATDVYTVTASLKREMKGVRN